MYNVQITTADWTSDTFRKLTGEQVNQLVYPYTEEKYYVFTIKKVGRKTKKYKMWFSYTTGITYISRHMYGKEWAKVAKFDSQVWTLAPETEEDAEMINFLQDIYTGEAE